MNELQMTFVPSTIEHLGVRMYSTLPPVLAELIANAYDADAKKVKLTFNDIGTKEIVIEDDGSGMTFKEINESFLRIGRNRRENEVTGKTHSGRKVIGKKGLGKLSFFGIAQEIEVETIKNNLLNCFKMDWDKIKNIKDELGNYKPDIIKENKKSDKQGTKITLRKIQRTTSFNVKDIANSLSKFFIIDSEFQIILQHNKEKPTVIDNKQKYEGLEKEIEWEVPNDICLNEIYENKALIIGHLIATKKPISPKTNMRGITLFSRKKLVNNPEYFSDSTSSHFFEYLTGYLEVDFIDDLPEDVISTNRQSLNWENPEMIRLKEYLQKIIRWLEKDWRKKRSEKKKEEVKKQTKVDVANWYKKLPNEIQSSIEPVVRAVMDDSELPMETQTTIVQNLHALIPEYPYYHWRHLHTNVQNASKTDYTNKDFYRAFQEASKRYITEVQNKSNENSDGVTLMGKVYGREKDKKLKVAKKYSKSFKILTIDDIEEGQKLLSMGIISGARNPMSHEEITELRDKGLFTEKDCLDALSLLSQLFRRLDDAE